MVIPMAPAAMFATIAPDHLHDQLPANAYYQLVHTLRRTLPPPLTDSPEDLLRRDHAAIASIAALAPANTVEAGVAAQYVAAELRKLGLDVKLEKVVVPHWVRGEETGALVEFPGMAPGTTQKVVLTALGGSVATPAQGITAFLTLIQQL